MMWAGECVRRVAGHYRPGHRQRQRRVGRLASAQRQPFATVFDSSSRQGQDSPNAKSAVSMPPVFSKVALRIIAAFH
ncbi:hypothetical protein WQQ_45560 [Hydrocarboniphaga effusa AP103]|uniref:Uncharacterized protein n=1 Tax=Hydrocarboniphaga effusa AP103 TaxID=1172194 RepID=I8HXJ9_9GAMM|nr:hypothetical protein WQQ_45560 [Hydrocarboniphaga effusa AP103]